jgi:hypothetical protein
MTRISKDFSLKNSFNSSAALNKFKQKLKQFQNLNVVTTILARKMTLINNFKIIKNTLLSGPILAFLQTGLEERHRQQTTQQNQPSGYLVSCIGQEASCCFSEA